MKGRINLDNENSPDPYDYHHALYLYLPEIESTMTVVQIRAVQIEAAFHRANSLNSITILTIFLIYIYSGSWHDERPHQFGL